MAYLDTINDVWGIIKDSFAENMSKTEFDLWFGKLVIQNFDMDNKQLIFTIDSELKQRVVNEKYLASIRQKFCEIMGFDTDVQIKLSDTPKSFKPITNRIANNNGNADGNHNVGSTIPPFNFEYTFDNFIVGSSNKFAHAACLAVSEHPAMDYNPLFIYGPSGIGKTHLLYAITNALKQKKQDISVIYIKGDDFTNQMIDSLARQSMSEFREKYRSCDVLLIDDIQFIAGKVATQEEFFHTFNALFDYGKQIILTSDRPPREIKTLEDRLKTRFEWGLIADIQPPDLELRTAIIKKKADQANIVIPEDVLYFLAENLRSNIRQIEGAIRKLSARHFISGDEITMEVSKSCISDLLGGAEPVSVTVDKIFNAIYNKYGINKEDLVSSKRTQDIAAKRHLAIYLIRTITEMSLPNIGKIFDRDHTTIMSSINLITKKIDVQPSFKSEVDNLINDVKEM